MKSLLRKFIKSPVDGIVATALEMWILCKTPDLYDWCYFHRTLGSADWTDPQNSLNFSLKFYVEFKFLCQTSNNTT